MVRPVSPGPIGVGHRLRLALPGLITLALLAACGDPIATRAGGREQPRTLSAASSLHRGYPSGDTLEFLAAGVTERSGGTLVLQTVQVGDLAPDPGTDPSVRVLDLVRNGSLDVGVIATRVLDLQGVTSLQALQTPLLFDSAELADAVVTDPIAEEMMGPISGLGVTPLVLSFDGLRDIKGYQKPLTKPADYAGAAIGFSPSALTRVVLAALGATQGSKDDSEFEKGITDGTTNGLEDSINQTNQIGRGWSVGNQILSFKANVTVVNSAVAAGLTAAQLQVLRQSALDARTFASTDMSHHMDLREAAQKYCADGDGDVVIASDADTEAMREALRPVLRTLRADPLTARAIDRIEELKRSVRGTPGVACTSSTAAPG